MAIAFTHPIQGPDPDATGRGWQSLADQLLAAREQQRLREQARAAALFQEKQLAAQQKKWEDEVAIGQQRADADRTNAEASKLREQRNDRRYTDEKAVNDQTRERERSIKDAEIEQRARQMWAAGDKQGANALMESIGRQQERPAPSLTATQEAPGRFRVSEIPIEGKQAPVAAPEGRATFRSADGRATTFDADETKAAQEAARLDKAARALAPYADLATSDPDIKAALDLTKRRIMAGGGDADKALDDFGAMVSKIQGDRSAEKRSRISANARPNQPGEKPAEVKAAGFAERIGKQREIIESAGGMSPEGAETMRRDRALSDIPVVGWLYKGAKGLVPSLDPKSNMSERDRAVANATAELSAANLRNESGGAITEGEERSNERRLMRDPSDTDEDWARKVQAMRDLENAARRQAGLPTKLFDARAHSKSRADRVKNKGKSLSELSDEEFTR